MATLTVTYSRTDTTPPTVAITSPVSTLTYSTSSGSVSLIGTAADDFGVTQVSWSCDRCGSGVASGTTSWTVSGITLAIGVNIITVTAQDAAGNRGMATLTVTYTRTDTTPPTVAITSPVSIPTYNTSSGSLNLGGTAADDFGVTQVSWSCDRCGSGAASGTTSWTINGITLAIGVNTITVTAQDAAGNRGIATITVTYITAPALSITKTHTGNFSAGQRLALYNVTVSSSPSAGPTSGVVTITESLPSGLTLVSMSGSGWACSGSTCTRSDVLAAGASYASILVYVDVAPNAISPQVNSVTVSGTGFSPSVSTDSTVIVNPPTPFDFNADSRADILWQLPSTGDLWVWFMNGTALAANAALSGPTSWRVPAAADFNGDGKPDILWQHPSTGDLWVWFMNGTSWAGQSPLGGPSDWRVVGTGDFNGDGKPDILWQHPASGELWVWYMNGTSWTGQSQISTATPWRVVGTADLNGDGKPDLLWQHPASGELWVWLMNGAGWAGQVQLNTATPWKVVGMGDYNGDGKPDILWQHPATGELWTWLMNGTAMASSVQLGGATPWNAIGSR